MSKNSSTDSCWRRKPCNLRQKPCSPERHPDNHRKQKKSPAREDPGRRSLFINYVIVQLFLVRTPEIRSLRVFFFGTCGMPPRADLISVM